MKHIMRRTLACVTGSRLRWQSLLRPSCSQRPVVPSLRAHRMILQLHHPDCCSTSSSSSFSSSASESSESSDLSAASNPSSRQADDDAMRLRMGIMSRSSSLPDVINQFESYLLSELESSENPCFTVVTAANPAPADDDDDDDDDDHAHDPDRIVGQDGTDVRQEVALRFQGSAESPEYVICLDERLLDHGIVGWWSRETSLQEEMHCSHVLDYVRNYARAVVRQRRRQAEQKQQSPQVLQEPSV